MAKAKTKAAKAGVATAKTKAKKAHGHSHSHAHSHGDGHAHSHGDGHGHSHGHGHGHGHGDGHGHGHGHSHSHGHGHGDGHSHVEREGLAKGAGKGKLLFLDAPSGIAGDMTIAALVDLGVPVDAILGPVQELGLDHFHVHVDRVERSGIAAVQIDVHVDGKQPERTHGSIKKLLRAAKIAPSIRERALLVFERLARAESTVHRTSIDDVHFHEVGAVDAIVDVVGAAAAIDWLDAEIEVSPLPMGRGFVKARHGVLPLPPPATVECLLGLETYDGGLDFEFVTPTGAAICGALASRSTRWPSIAPIRTGWGAGHAILPDRPNLLRAVLGDRATKKRAQGETHVVIEANLDDATGELVGACIESALEAGAVDAWAAPITMKKGRPGLVLSAIAPRAASDAVSRAILRDSTSLGVRLTPVARVELPRRIEVVATSYGDIPVKVSGDPSLGALQTKPEFDVCRRAAAEHGVPIREVLRAALAAAADLSAPTP